MSTGGYFKLITNEGMQDKLIMATGFLNERLKCIIDKQYSRESWSTKLHEIEKTHTVYVNSSFKPFVSLGYEYSKLQSKGLSALGTQLSFTVPQFGDFFNDTVIHITLSGLKALDPQDKVRYVAMLGHKIIKNSTFYLQNIKIDEYTSDHYNAYYNFWVPPAKKTGWLRNMGQEIPTLGYITTDPLNDEYREYRWIGNGPQTFKQGHDTVELWIPTLFWFKDIKHSVPNLVFPYGQTRIDLEIAPASELISFASYGGSGKYIEPVMTQCEMYTNHIFLDPSVHSIFVNAYGFSLIRLHRTQTFILTEPSQELLLPEFKWPIESIYFAFRPVANQMNSQYWHKNTALTPLMVPIPVAEGCVIGINEAVFQQETPTVDTVQFSIHGINIMQETNMTFFNSYLPYRFGEFMNTPEDLGWYFINFNIEPGSKNPSGHLNISMAREFYIKYKSSYININRPTELLLLADALNFLIIKDGRGYLKFST